MTAWIIIKDQIADKSEPEGTNLNAKGLIGPGIATERDMQRLRNGEGQKFRLLDDDGEVYYIGRQLTESECTEEYEEGMFGGDSQLAPFDDFGRPNAGCAQMEIWVRDVKSNKMHWEGLM